MVADKHSKRIAGVKAKHMQSLGENEISGDKREEYPIHLVMIISPICNRISLFLRDLFKKHQKYFLCDGVELYRQAVAKMNHPIGQRTVALIITDQPDDYHLVSEHGVPYWKETVAAFQSAYHEKFAAEIEEEVLPQNLTVITMFRHRKGKLSETEVESIEQEFEKLKEEMQLEHKACESEEELRDIMENQVEEMVERFRQRESLRKFQRNRNQRLAKAKKITKDAHLKALRGE